MLASSLHQVLALACAWLVIGALGLLRQDSVGWTTRILYPAGAIVGLGLATVALLAIFEPAASLVLPLGLPDLPFHARLDALSAFFLLLLGAVAAGVSVYAGGYFRQAQGTAPGLLCLYFHVFLASMALVMLADDAYFFMVAWETMALQAGAGDYTFEHMRALQPSAAWASAACLLALVGFGAKAGIVPLHVWLPEAHPAAPSPVSALLSAVMLKTAIYGLIRVTLDLIGSPLWWWGVIALVLGLVSALGGIVFAAVQTDMKRLLAYSSIETVGLIFAGFGLTLIFHGFGMGALAALALTATLYHCLNHAFYKSLLFLCTGSVLHATRERSLGRLGGLIAAAVALTAALSGYVMVKFFGVVFLGQHREARLAEAREAGMWERAGLAWLAAACIFLGLVPATVIGLLDPITRELTGFGIGNMAQGWLFIAPINAERASYSPLLVFTVTALLVAVAWLAVRAFYHGRARRAPAWDCGFPDQDARMQDSAEGFGQPVRHVFAPFFRLEEHAPAPDDAQPRFSESAEDRLWYWIYLPVARAVERLTALVTLLQRGRISVYLAYSFVTLLALLLFAR